MSPRFIGDSPTLVVLLALAYVDGVFSICSAVTGLFAGGQVPLSIEPMRMHVTVAALSVSIKRVYGSGWMC